MWQQKAEFSMQQTGGIFGELPRHQQQWLRPHLKFEAAEHRHVEEPREREHDCVHLAPYAWQARGRAQRAHEGAREWQNDSPGGTPAATHGASIWTQRAAFYVILFLKQV